jgi:hypothetical protein
MRAARLQDALERLTAAIRDVESELAAMKAEHDPLASHIFVSRRHYRNVNDTKSGKRREMSGEPTRLNFDLKAAPGSRASVTANKGRHWVWVPAFTGSRLPGRWVELNDSGSWAAEASTLDVVRVSGEELQRTSRNSYSHRLPGH